MITINNLKQLPCACDMEPSELEVLQSKLVPVEINAGQAVFKEGDTSTDLYIVISGNFKVTKDCGSGQIEEINTIKAPSIIGEISFLIERPRSATVVSNDKATLYRLSKEDWNQLAKDHQGVIPKMLTFFSSVLAHRLYDLDGKVCAIVERVDKNEKPSEMADLERFRNKLYNQWNF